MKPFEMGSLDHIHTMAPGRHEAVAWYGEQLGFEDATVKRLLVEPRGIAPVRFWSRGPGLGMPRRSVRLDGRAIGVREYEDRDLAVLRGPLLIDQVDG